MEQLRLRLKFGGRQINAQTAFEKLGKSVFLRKILFYLFAHPRGVKTKIRGISKLKCLKFWVSKVVLYVIIIFPV